MTKNNRDAAKEATIYTGVIFYIAGGILAMIPIGMYFESLYGGPYGIVAIVIYLIVWVWTGFFVAFRR